MKPKFRVVVLESPYDVWSDPSVQKLFCRMADLKINGYAAEYPYGILPLDTTDFIATHLMICQEKGEELEPVLAYRSLTLSKALLHKQSFPVLALMKAVGAKEHETAIAQIVQECQSKKIELAYDSSYTIRPDLRGDTELHDLVKMMLPAHHMDYRLEQGLAGGAIRFKMPRLYGFYGFKDLSLDGRTLDPINVPFAFDEPTRFFHITDFTELARAHCKKFRSHWDNRIHFSKETLKKKKAA